MKVLHLLPWPIHPLSHGGVRRTAQIHEWLRAQIGCSPDTWVINPKPAGVATLPVSALLRGGWLAARQPLLSLSARGKAKYGALAALMSHAIAQSKPDLLVVETAPPHALLAGLVASRLGVPYIVCPHNVESLVPGQALPDFANRGAVLECEAQVMTRARLCVTISPLDDGVYTTLGARTALLPYYPVSSELARFEAIRNNRANYDGKAGVLVLGSVSNQPTLEGMRSIVAELRARPPLGDEVVHVAGYRTEGLRALEGGVVKVHGTVSDDHLNALLTSVRCVVLRQPFTTGGLTRLVEFNQCGIPVIVTGGYIQALGEEAYGIFARDSLPKESSFYHQIGKPVYHLYQNLDLKI